MSWWGLILTVGARGSRQGVNRVGELVDGLDEAVDALPVGLGIALLELQPPLLDAEEVPVPSLLPLIAGLKGFCYDGRAPRDGGAHSFVGRAAAARCMSSPLALVVPSTDSPPPPLRGGWVRLLVRFRIRGFAPLYKCNQRNAIRNRQCISENRTCFRKRNKRFNLSSTFVSMYITIRVATYICITHVDQFANRKQTFI